MAGFSLHADFKRNAKHRFRLGKLYRYITCFGVSGNVDNNDLR
jgi:hypothetical protein